MSSPNDVLVITTDSPSESQILKHLKPVTSHIVAGTNLFSDFFGSMSDVFGGRSGSYQKQLNSIYNEAIQKIKTEAFRIGGNCVVGLKIDIDEISGKGKSMFMITAIGTAVVIGKRMVEEKEKGINSGFIEREKIAFLKELKRVTFEAENQRLDLNNSTWEFIIGNRISEVYEEIIRQLEILLSNNAGYAEEIKNKFIFHVEAYLRALDQDIKEHLIYTSLTKEEPIIQRFLRSFIKDNYLLNINRCTELLENESIKLKKLGLIISCYDKEYYSKEDIENYSKLPKIIQSNFKNRGTITQKGTILSSKEKEVWLCECGKSNRIDQKYCGKCSNDIKGFKEEEVSIETALKHINNKIEIIEEIRKSS